MSYTMPPSGYTVPEPPAGQPRRRPGTVSAASGLLYLLTFLSLAAAALWIYFVNQIPADIFTQVADEAGQGADPSLAKSVFYIIAVPFVVFAILYLLLAIFVGKGKQWARIFTWIVAPISTLCCFPYMLLSNVGSMVGGMGGTSNINQDELTRKMLDAQPGWLPAVNAAVYGLGILVGLVVILLLLLPPSHPFFRKPEPQWTPPAYPAP